MSRVDVLVPSRKHNRRNFLKALLAIPGMALAGRVAGKSEDRFQPGRPLGDAQANGVDLAASTPNTWTSGGHVIVFDTIYMVLS